jgi:class 3 adenylate cyclase/isopentenyldiphosphate isomerase
MDVNALVLFTDARGFTTWANNPEVFARLDQFSALFTRTLLKAFPKGQFFVKGLGDGAMIVRELDREVETVPLLQDTLKRIQKVKEEFAQVCADFAHSIGHKADLNLGWGIVRGPVQMLDGGKGRDFVGPNVNKCARLCSIARPYGVVIDRDDFPVLPQVSGFQFFEQKRKLTGIEEDVDVWVTEEISTQFLTREKLKQTPEVHVAGQCIAPSGKKSVRILIAKRSLVRRLYPNRYEGCGGQLAANENFVEGVVRHFRMEMGIDVRVLDDLHCFYEIREPNEPVIPGLRFLCVQIGEREPKSFNHVETKWVSENEFRSMEADAFVPQLKEQVLNLLAKYRQSR